MPPSSSLARRALLAVGLMIGFYVLALAVAGALLGIAYAYAAHGKHIQIRVILFCGIGALTILWSILPQIDKFPPPGPSLKPEEQPDLFEAITGIAKATGQAMPMEVYLVPDVNAWVAQRGGVMGFCSRRVMGLGLPLMRVLSVSQFKAVLAHEFGHYHQGDTRLGPWVYKTRAAIGRTLQGLSESVLQALFLWYGKMFLKITQQVSRQQEFVADRLSAQTAGSRAAIGGLMAVHRHAPAYNSYWMDEVVPVLQAGYKPPIADGFAAFIKSSLVADQTSAILNAMLRQEETDPYDTHPSLRERIAALEQLPPEETPQDDRPALALLENVSDLETALLDSIAGGDVAQQLKPVTWEDVPMTVLVDSWKLQVKANAAGLVDIAVRDLPRIVTDRILLEKMFQHPGRKSMSYDQRVTMMLSSIGSALSLVLLEQNWNLNAAPGEAVNLTSGGLKFEPFIAILQLADRKLSAEEWEKTCREMGIGDVEFNRLDVAAGDSPSIRVPFETIPCPRCDAKLPIVREPGGEARLTCPNCGKVFTA